MTWTPTTGIRQDRRGYRVWVWASGRNVSRRFPPDTKIETMAAWRLTTKATASTIPRPTRPVGLRADVARYLAIVAGMPTIATRRQHLEDWLTALGPERVHASVTSAEIAATLAEWQRARTYSASTLNHRRGALAHLYARLWPAEPNPVRAVPKFREPPPAPRGLPAYVVDAILEALPARAVKHRGSVPSQTAAQLRAMALTGLPPSTLARITKDHLAELDHGRLLVPGRRKGRGTAPAVHAVTPDGASALRICFGIGACRIIPSSTRLLVWRRAVTVVRLAHPSWPIPADVRPYDLRHSYGTLAYAATHDLQLVAGLLGHADARTTRRYAAAAIPDGEQAAVAKLAEAWLATRARAPQGETLPAPSTPTPRPRRRRATRR